MAESPQSKMICSRLHQVFNTLSRHHFPFEEDNLPENGIYVLFERGERAHDGLDRIVRVGTHTGQGNLKQRLTEHFLVENKDRSIFRKNIGRALLNKQKDPFLVQWEVDLTSREERRRYAGKINYTRLAEVEAEVSKVIRKSFSFCVIPINNKIRRLELESGLIATINLCRGCRPSTNWLGNHSTKKQIRESGLWLVQGLNGQNLSLKNVEELVKSL
jgi:hypothetical protein